MKLLEKWENNRDMLGRYVELYVTSVEIIYMFGSALITVEVQL